MTDVEKIATVYEDEYLELNPPGKQKFSIADQFRIEEVTGVDWDRIQTIYTLKKRMAAIQSGEDVQSGPVQIADALDEAHRGVSGLKLNTAMIWAHYRQTNPWLTFKRFCDIDLEGLTELTKLVLETHDIEVGISEEDVPSNLAPMLGETDPLLKAV